VLKKVSNSEKSIEKFCNEIDANVKKYFKPKHLFIENYVAGTWLEFIKTLEGANDDLVVANTGVLVPNANGSLESSVSADNNIVQFISESLRINQDLAVELHKFWTRKGKFVDETFVMGNGIDIHNAARAAERPTQEVVRFILKKDYNTFEVSWFLKAVVEENEAFNEMRESNENKPNESLQLYLSNVADLKIIKSQIERKKENREKLTKEEDDFLNDFYDILAKERKEYDDRANLGSASGDESNLFLDEKKEK
jgi:hypothetical protein